MGPSHYLYYSSLHRRRLWLEHLARAFTDHGSSNWATIHRDLNTAHAKTLGLLSLEGHLGIQRPLPLLKALDDTPVDSFLATLTTELDLYQTELFELMQKYARDASWVAALEPTSMLWGRELAQECLIALNQKDATAQAIPGGKSVRAIFQVFSQVLEGGEFSWKPLLLRRCTDTELEYELRECPHRRQPENTHAKAHAACRLESMVYRGLVEALVPDVKYERVDRGSYCVDELHIR